MSQMIMCPLCGASIPSTAVLCPSCSLPFGAPSRRNLEPCPACSLLVSRAASTCPGCGHPLKPAPPPSQALPALASFFLPGLGQLIQGRFGVALGVFIEYCAVSFFVLLFGFAAVNEPSSPAKALFVVSLAAMLYVWIRAILDAASYQP